MAAARHRRPPGQRALLGPAHGARSDAEPPSAAQPGPPVELPAPRVPLVWPVCLGGAAACIFVMKGLPSKAWERFGIWLAIGLALYVAYGYWHSRLHVRRLPLP